MLKSISQRSSIACVLAYVDVCMYTHIYVCECKIPKLTLFLVAPHCSQFMLRYKNSFILLIFSFLVSKIFGLLVLSFAKACKSLSQPSHLAHFNQPFIRKMTFGYYYFFIWHLSVMFSGLGIFSLCRSTWMNLRTFAMQSL